MNVLSELKLYICHKCLSVNAKQKMVKTLANKKDSGVYCHGCPECGCKVFMDGGHLVNIPWRD